MATTRETYISDHDLEAQEAEAAEEELQPEESMSFLDALQLQFGAVPWWVISSIVHAIIIVLFSYLTYTIVNAVATAEIPIADYDQKDKEEEEYDKHKKRDVFKRDEMPMKKEIEKPYVWHEEVEISDHFETDNDMDKMTARGDPNNFSDVPLGGTSVVANIGVGGGGAAGVFGFRDGGGRKKCVARFGGSDGTESAVEAALRWLAAHQEPDGHWDTVKLEARLPAETKPYDCGVTGLAALAFLGAGYTPTVESRFKDNIARALAWIIAQQQANGLIDPKLDSTDDEGPGYSHSICGLALAEAYGMTKDGRYRGPAQKAIDYSVNVHQVEGSGWRYNARQAADLSVTGWFVMQLKSANIAGLSVSKKSFSSAQAFCDTVSDKYGRFRYKPERRSSTHTMTSVGMVSRLFLGWGPGELQGGAEYLLEDLPDWGDNGSSVNFYYWYYGTLGMFQMGKPYWPEWNKAIREMLPANQRTADDGDLDGSWDPCGPWCSRTGRAFSTAMGALVLEVYYRYLPMYQ